MAGPRLLSRVVRRAFFFAGGPVIFNFTPVLILDSATPCPFPGLRFRVYALLSKLRFRVCFDFFFGVKKEKTNILLFSLF